MKQIVECFLNGDELTKSSLIKKYGEKRLKSAIEEYQSVELITSTSKQCPSCKAWMQKLDGCNKMTCCRCHCYFCWLCLKSLPKADPYSHFNTALSGCFDKLFENITDDVDNDFDWLLKKHHVKFNFLICFILQSIYFFILLYFLWLKISDNVSAVE